jgi:toxin ParE1/3/4
MPEYRLTHAAEQDLLQIALFGIERFGALRARTYYDRLVRRFEELATHPERYRKVDHSERLSPKCMRHSLDLLPY